MWSIILIVFQIIFTVSLSQKEIEDQSSFKESTLKLSNFLESKKNAQNSMERVLVIICVGKDNYPDVIRNNMKILIKSIYSESLNLNVQTFYWFDIIDSVRMIF